MGDRVAVMKDGVLQQCDTPLTLYDNPENIFVAGFIGSPAMNLISGKLNENGVEVGDWTVPVMRDVLDKAKGEDTLTIGIRPEDFELGDHGIPVDIAVVEELGADAFTYGTLAGLSDDDKLSAPQIVARLSGRQAPERGATVRFAAGEGHKLHVFSNKSGERLS